MRHVIIGTGPAGVIAAETIRKNAPHDDILLIGGEAEPPYARMSIPQWLSGQIGEGALQLRRDPDYFAQQRIQLKRACVQHLSDRTRHVKLDDGSSIAFDSLLIATGASPRIPAIPGIDLPSVHACWTLPDARRITALAQLGARVVLIGAGFIGCIVMEALAARGVRLAVVEKRDSMLSAMLSRSAGSLVKLWCERKGIKVFTAARVTSIDMAEPWGGSSLKLVRLSSGEQLQADLVVYCTGTTPNTGFLNGSDIRCLQGVVVDERMRTNLPGIYAAGDCAERFDPLAGRSVIAGVQPNAADQAYCAALNMTGRRAFQYGARCIDVVDTMGLISSSFGQWQGVRGGQWVEYCDTRNIQYLRLEFGGDVLVGCTTVGFTGYATILRGLIQSHVRLSEWKDRLLSDPLLVEDAYRDCMQRQYMWQGSTFHAPAGAHGVSLRVV